MENSKLILVLLLSLFFSVSAISAEKIPLSIISTDGRAICLNVELGITPQEQQQGLMYRKMLPENDGMLFVFNDERRRNFWMKNTRIPLSIAYINGGCVINEIYDMKPFDTSVIYPSRYPARYALEVNQGWFEKHGIRPGCRVIMNGRLGK